MKSILDTSSKTVYVPVRVEDELPPLPNRYTYIYGDGETLCMAAEARHTAESLTRSRITHWLKEIPVTDATPIVDALKEAKDYFEVNFGTDGENYQRLSAALELLTDKP